MTATTKQQTIEAINVRAAALAEHVKVEDGKIIVGKEAYGVGSPECLTDEVHKALNEHNSIFLPAITKVVGDKSLELARDNAELTRVVTSIPLHGRDVYKVTWDKEVTRPAAPGSSENVTIYGQTRGSLKFAAAASSRAGMAHVLDGLQKAAMEAFGK